ncbi:hypothetical protein AOC25_06825 [Polynucleobacter asymbioticus]|uniref:DUF1376 domain-containing protein n=2 Tax=Polynucleobacter asymbioticus TaxID=576611 RepID=A0AAC9NGF2_9BURK|nr:hypothetical protein AOC25_06825 [Polynucleobacter asymbioticus]
MAYLRILWLYYDKDGIVEHDVEQIAFEVGSDPKTVELIIKTYFQIEGNFIKQSRCDKEIAGYLKKSTGGKEGANKRWNNKDSDSLPNGLPNADAMPTQCDPNANQEPITNNHKPIKNKNITTPDGVDVVVFNDFVALRKSKKSPVTETVIKTFEKEAQKAGLSLQDVMELCIKRGWVGFEANWVDPKPESRNRHDRQMKTLAGLTGGIHGNSSDANFIPINESIDMENSNANLLG